MVDSIANILPINIIGVVSGTSAVGTPTDIFSRATIQNVVIVNEDPISVKIFGSVVAATGTFSQSLTISGLSVATSDDVTALQTAISGVEASDVDALTVSGGATIAGTIDFIGSGGTNLSSAGQIITIDTSGLQAQIDAVEASDVDALTVSGGPGVGGTIDFVGADGTNVSRSGQTITITSAEPVTATGGGGGLNNVVEDTTPELGGTLDALSEDIINVNELTAVSGTFTSGLTVGTGSTVITTDTLTTATGSLTMKLLIPAGISQSNPGLQFADTVGGPAAGLFLDGSNMSLINNGTQAIKLSGNFVEFSSRVQVADGVALAPRYTFRDDTNTGIFRVADNELGFAADGAERAKVTISGVVVPESHSYFVTVSGVPVDLQDSLGEVNTAGNIGGASEVFKLKSGPELVFRTLSGSTNVTVSQAQNTIAIAVPNPLKVADGDAADPNYSFNLDTDTGMFRPSDDVIGFATGGILRASVTTSGIVIPGPGGLTAVTGTFTEGLTVGGGSTVIDGGSITTATGSFTALEQSGAPVPMDLQEAYDLGDGVIITSSGKPVEVAGDLDVLGIAAIAGTLNIPAFPVDPPVSDGDVWINTTTSGLRYHLGGVTLELLGVPV